MKSFTLLPDELELLDEFIGLWEKRATSRGGDMLAAFRQATPFFRWLQARIKDHRFSNDMRGYQLPLTIKVSDSEVKIMELIVKKVSDPRQIEHERFHALGLYCHACQEF